MLEAPAVKQHDRAPQHSGERDLRKGAPLAADRDHDVGGGDDGEVPSVPDAGRDRDVGVGVGRERSEPGSTPTTAPPASRGAARRSLHRAALPARDDVNPAAASPCPIAGARAATRRRSALARDRGVPPPGSSRQAFPYIKSSAPASKSGSFRLPHLGDWTHDGQPGLARALGDQAARVADEPLELARSRVA